MKVYKANDDIRLAEQILEEENQEITHLSLKSGGDLKTHSHPWTVVVVIYKGNVDFTGENGTQTIEPGTIIRLEPGEDHSLVALEDSDLMVIKSKLEK